MSEGPGGALHPAELLQAAGGHARRPLETAVQTAPLHVDTGDSEQREDHGMERNQQHRTITVAV